MDLLIATNSVPLASADVAPASGTPQYATDGNPGATPAVPPTQIPAYHYNAMMTEIRNVILAAGIVPSGADNTQLLAGILGLFRTRVYGTTLNLYVSPTGSDSNAGTSAAEPFLTINGALAAAAQNFDFANSKLVINLAAGTYAGCTVSGSSLPVPVTISGNTASPSTVTISGSGIGAVTADNVGLVTVEGVTLIASGSGSGGGAGMCLNAQGGTIAIGPGIIFGNASFSHITASVSGFVGFGAGASSYTISGSAPNHWYTSSNGLINVSGGTLSLASSVPAFSTAFASCSGGTMTVNSMTFSGTASGVRYLASSYGVINTNGASASYLPGSSAGTTSNGLYQ